MEEYSQLFGEKNINEGESQAPSIPRIAVETGMIHVNHEPTEESEYMGMIYKSSCYIKRLLSLAGKIWSYRLR